MRDLHIRTIQVTDFERYAELSHYAFGVQKDRELTLLRQYTDPQHILVAELNGQIIAQVFIHTLGVWVNGACLPMGGVAGVATAPEQRHQGYATQLLIAALQTMRDLGYVVSMLFPAVYSLYRRLGWAIADSKYVYTAPPKTFQVAKHLVPTTSGRIEHRYSKLDDIPTLQAIRRRYGTTHNGFVERDRLGWELRSLHFADSVKSQWLVLNYDERGEPDGYILYKIVITPEGQRHLVVDELLTITSAALYRLISFLSNHTTFSLISLSLSTDVPLLVLLSNPLELQSRIDPHALAMLRIVDLQSALTSRPILNDHIAGKLILQITDPIALWNNGFWLITLESAHVTCEKISVDSGYDAFIDISVLGQLFVGFISVTIAIQTRLIHIQHPSRLPLLEALFESRTPPYSGDSF